MPPTPIQMIATSLFAIAVIHTFLAKRFHALGGRFREGSVAENFFHLLGEVEIVFMLWAGALILAMVALEGHVSALQFVQSLDYTEPVFVFVIMAVASTRPVLHAANLFIGLLSRLMPLKKEAAYVFVALSVGPLLGSFITEPAAMTVTALLLKERLFDSSAVSRRLKYLALGVLFVNISIGGVLTPYAAPAVLMVAKHWDWDFSYMAQHFGWKAAVAVVANSIFLLLYGWKELSKIKAEKAGKIQRVPAWLVAVHLGFLSLIVLTAHHMGFFTGIFLFFLGCVRVSQEYQDEIKLRESLLVAAFLGGLVTLAELQQWWLQPLLAGFSEGALFLGCTALTAVTDNAALTFLGAQAEGLSEAMRYALVSGAVAGGGLTVIANAPNPAGFSILQKSFGVDGVSPLGLFLGALVPTAVDMLAFWFLPHFSI